MNVRDSQLYCERALHECLFGPVLVYRSEEIVEGEGNIYDYGCTDG